MDEIMFRSSDSSSWRTHYIAHIYAATNEWLTNHPEMKDTIVYLQMIDIRDQAALEFAIRDRAEMTQRAQEYLLAHA